MAQDRLTGPASGAGRNRSRNGTLEEQTGADAKELAELTRLRRTDASFPGQGLMDVAALSENRLEVGCRFPGVLQEELEPFGGGAIVWRKCVPAVVVLDQQGQQTEKFGFLRGAGPAFADQAAESAGDLAILRFRLDHLGQSLDQQFFIGGGGHGYKFSRLVTL